MAYIAHRVAPPSGKNSVNLRFCVYFLVILVLACIIRQRSGSKCLVGAGVLALPQKSLVPDPEVQKAVEAVVLVWMKIVVFTSPTWGKEFRKAS